MAGKQDPEYRKKKRVKVQRDAPFPVPIASITRVPCDENFWFNFTGYLENDSVIVSCSGDIKYLYKMGFFGRGLLSRGAVEFHQSSPYVYLPTDPGSDPSIVNVMRRRMYLRHKQWQKLQEGKNPDVDDKSQLDVEFDSDNECFQDTVMPHDWKTYENDKESQEEENSDETETSKHKALNIGTGACIQDIPDSKKESWDISDSPKGPFVKNGNNLSVNEVSKTLSGMDNYLKNDWNNSEADLEFWNKHPDSWNEEDKMSNKDGVSSDWDNCEADEEFWSAAVPSTSSSHGNQHKNDNQDFKNICQSEGHGDQHGDSWGTAVLSSPSSHGYEHKLDRVGFENSCQGDEFKDNDDCSPSKKRKVSAIKGSVLNSRTCENVYDTNIKDINTNFNENQKSVRKKESRKEESILDFEAASHFEGENCFLDSQEKDGSVLHLSDPTVDGETVDSCEGKPDSLNNKHDIVDKKCNETFKNENVEICDKNSKIILCNKDQRNDMNPTSSDLKNKNVVANLSESEMEVSGQDNSNDNKVKGVISNEQEIHPYCEVDDDDGDYLVFDDSDVEDHMTFEPNKGGYYWKPVLKKDPFPYTEPLVLSSEEAFFLSFGLGCLSVMDEDGQTALTLEELWHRFCQQPRFLPCYAAYHYFRSRGWVPKPGVIFGTDFLLYKEGPPFFHGSYSVIVKAVHSGTYKGVEEYGNRAFTWTSFSGLQRITEHVAKSLLVCYVIIPSNLTKDEKLSPACLSKLHIHLQKYSRWVSSQEREADKVTDMP